MVNRFYRVAVDNVVYVLMAVLAAFLAVGSIGALIVIAIACLAVGLFFIGKDKALKMIDNSSDWKDGLDGTRENGVWCFVFDEEGKNLNIAKVISINDGYFVNDNVSFPCADPVGDESLISKLEQEYG